MDSPAADLSAMNSHALLSWYTSTTTFLLDCDGVLWRASEGVAGVAETISLLRNEGRRVFFVTNNSTKSRDEYVAKLASVCGISSSPEDIISSAFAAAAYCKTRGFTRAYVVGQRGLADELAAVGVTPIGLTDGSLPFAFGSLRPSDLDPGVQAVVVGFDGEASYYKLNLAAAYLRERPEVAFVATNRDATYPDAHMIVSGGGTLVAAVALGAGREPDAVAGKPSTSLLDIIETTEALDRRATCMVGDRLDTDIAFGNAGRLGSTLLVLTGVTARGDADALPHGDVRRPSHVVSSFGDIARLIRAARGAIQE